jgi:hypothetical protein
MLKQDALIKSIIASANQLGGTVVPPQPGPGTKTSLTVSFASGEVLSIVIDQLYAPLNTERSGSNRPPA